MDSERSWPGLDRLGWLQAIGGLLLGLIALFSSYDHITLAGTSVQLKQQRPPIGVNDLHIAAHARSEGLTLVSNNLREFERVPGLLLENWA